MKALPTTIEPEAVSGAIDMMSRDVKALFDISGPIAVQMTKDVEVPDAWPVPVRARVTLTIIVEEVGGVRG